MNTLYFVAVYSHSENQWARILCTAPSVEDAKREALESLGEGWRVRHIDTVCQTHDNVYMEV